WAVLVGVLLGLALNIFLITTVILTQALMLLWVAVPLKLAWIFSLFGFVVNAPNRARVVTLLGKYARTAKAARLFYRNSLDWRKKVSLRLRTCETGMSATQEVRDAGGRVIQAATQNRQPLKVNDKDGTPIEISAVIVWRVTDAAQAVFQVDKYEDFVHTQ